MKNLRITAAAIALSLAGSLALANGHKPQNDGATIVKYTMATDTVPGKNKKKPKHRYLYPNQPIRRQIRIQHLHQYRLIQTGSLCLCRRRHLRLPQRQHQTLHQHLTPLTRCRNQTHQIRRAQQRQARHLIRRAQRFQARLRLIRRTQPGRQTLAQPSNFKFVLNKNAPGYFNPGRSCYYLSISFSYSLE